METEIFILAGGKSSRMGQDKGRILLGEKEMILYILDTLKQLNLSAKIIANHLDYQKFGCEVFSDIITEKGPMGGLHTAFHYNTKDAVFLISCDMPFINRQAIEKLLANACMHDITVAAIAGQINPLFAVYRQTLKNKVLSCLKEEQLKMKNLVLISDYQIVEMDDLVAENPFLFFNLNEKKDILQSSALWEKKE